MTAYSETNSNEKLEFILECSDHNIIHKCVYMLYLCLHQKACLASGNSKIKYYT